MKTVIDIVTVLSILSHSDDWSILFDRNAIHIKNEYHSLTFDNYPGIRPRDAESIWYRLETEVTGEISVSFDYETIFMTC